MKVRPIIFQPEMVRALLAGRKTQTRRLRYSRRKLKGSGNAEVFLNTISPLARVEVGDVLYVRETHAPRDGRDGKPDLNPRYVKFRADNNEKTPSDPMDWHHWPDRWTPAIHMRRAFSRLTLAVTEVRFESVQNISDEDAIAEGIVRGSDGYWGWGEPCTDESNAAPEPAEAYELLWREINGDASWNEDPEVVVIGFEVHRQNVDEFLRAGACFRETT